ncbi:MAG TPA: hypothetical protein VLA04_06730 [Verrucomicrobiae bacterium]|nr:hypothetical protein [Verrucomicrobiae bacterium]
MNDDLKKRLKSLGLSDEQIEKLIAEGATNEGDIALISGDDIKTMTGCGLVTARKVADSFKPAPAATTAAVTDTVIGEHDKPTETQIGEYASTLGMDSNTLMMFMMANAGSGMGMDMDLSTMLPIPSIVAGYNPKIRNMPYLVMGQVERRLATPIIVINANGSVNVDLTNEYIKSLEEGFPKVEDGVYYDTAGAPYQVIRVGVDAQSVYDSDPVASDKALQPNGMGTGRINWNRVPIDVRQVVFFAVTQTNELNPGDETQLGRLRDKVKPEMNRLELKGDFPKAINAYNEALRTGSLPNLRVQLSRTAQTPRTMPNRGRTSPRDLAGAGARAGGGAGHGDTFPDE